MLSRRRYLQSSLAMGALAAAPFRLRAADALLTRAIPATGERLPVMGLGTSASFGAAARDGDTARLCDVLRALLDGGATVVDTAPAYGAAEQVAGDCARQLTLTDRAFWATKLNVAGRGGGRADATAARAQVEESFQRLGTRVIDLIQVHNLADVPTHLAVLREFNAAGRVRYLGVTTTQPARYAELLQVMQREPLDFIGIDYAIDNRTVEREVLPLAKERRIGVLVYLPFGRQRLWDRVRGQALPDWAADFDAASWAQFFLKFVLAHPAVTAVTPATGSVAHMLDNLGAARGRLPDAGMRERMIAHLEGLRAVA
jgi:aryl-alcohol dehydrogenase-like predicted oxidoreductase